MGFHVVSTSLHLGPAYLDGGTGTMLFQAAIAGLLSVGFVIKTRWMQMKSALVARKRNSVHND